MADQIELVFRNESGRVLATLIRLVGDFELAEDAMQDAFAAALAQWPSEGTPANPRAWLVNVGRHKAIDRLETTGWRTMCCA
jgi:RNA polymerase sigma-70 factor (ECF subfamily)